MRPQGVLGAAEVYVQAGRLGEGYATGEQALALARERAERPLQAQALALLGRIAADRDPPEIEEAEARYREALALADALGMRPLVAHCHLGLGKLSRRTGKGERAPEHLTTATAMYRDMDMRFWLGQAEGEMVALNPAVAPAASASPASRGRALTTVARSSGSCSASPAATGSGSPK